MYLIISLLALPVLIKLFTNLGILKLKLIPKKQITAQMLIEDMNKRKIRPLRVEQQYNLTYYNFNNKLKNKEINRDQIVAIREYLNLNVKAYPHKKFKNDAHAIYSMLRAKDISVRDLQIVNQLIS